MDKIEIKGDIGWYDVSADSVASQLEGKGDVIVEIDSFGGSVTEGIAIFNLLANHNGKVDVVVTGTAASIATYIALAGDTLSVYDNTIWMIHNAWTIAVGDHNEMAKVSNNLKGITAIIRDKYTEKTGKSETEIANKMDEESYFFGNEIVEFGFADAVIESKKKKNKDALVALASNNFHLAMARMKEKGPKENFEMVAALGDNPAPAQITQTTKEGQMAIESEDTILASERERISAILNLKGSDAIKQQAILDGLSVGETAIRLNQELDSIISEQKTNFESASQEIQDIAIINTTSAVDEDDSEFYAKRKGGINANN